MFKNTILAALMASFANAQSDTWATCNACITNGGRQCLTSAGGVTFYDTGTCCKSTDKSVFCTKPYGQASFNYCSTTKTITNTFLQQWTCPQREDKCPAQKDVLITVAASKDGKDGEWTERKWTWGKDQPTPDAAAKDWNCKYHVTTDQTDGYIVVQTEQYGFDEYVTILAQPKVDPTASTKTYLQDSAPPKNPVYQAKFSQKFYLDVKKYDALISFKPEKVYETNPIKENYMGSFKVRAMWVKEATADQLKNIPTAAEKLTEAGKVATNWDNEVIPAGKWFDRKVFSIGDFEVTFFGLAVGAGGLAAIIIVLSCICCCISYRKRHAIADGARRASSAVRRGSEAVRKSFSGKKNQEQGNAVAADTFYSNDKPINDVHRDMLNNMDEAAKPDYGTAQ